MNQENIFKSSGRFFVWAAVLLFTFLLLSLIWEQVTREFFYLFSPQGNFLINFIGFAGLICTLYGITGFFVQSRSTLNSYNIKLNNLNFYTGFSLLIIGSLLLIAAMYNQIFMAPTFPAFAIDFKAFSSILDYGSLTSIVSFSGALLFSGGSILLYKHLKNNSTLRNIPLLLFVIGAPLMSFIILPVPIRIIGFSFFCVGLFETGRFLIKTEPYTPQT